MANTQKFIVKAMTPMIKCMGEKPMFDLVKNTPKGKL